MPAQAQSKVADAARIGAAAARSFLSEYRELLSSFHWSDVEPALGSWLQLDGRSQIEGVVPSIELYVKVQRIGFLTLLDEQVIQPVAAITPLGHGQADLDSMRRATGIGVANLPAPAVAKTPQEIYEDGIVNDWNTLSGDQFRAKCNNDKRYRDTFKALSETDRIKNRVAPTPANLEEIVRSDWKALPTQEIRQKCKDNPAYKQVLDRLADANAL